MTDFQAIVTEDVNWDGQEARVINVIVACFGGVLVFFFIILSQYRPFYIRLKLLLF